MWAPKRNYVHSDNIRDNDLLSNSWVYKFLDPIIITILKTVPQRVVDVLNGVLVSPFLSTSFLRQLLLDPSVPVPFLSSCSRSFEDFCLRLLHLVSCWGMWRKIVRPRLVLLLAFATSAQVRWTSSPCSVSALVFSFHLSPLFLPLKRWWCWRRLVTPERFG